MVTTADCDRLTERQVTLVLQHLGAEIVPDDAGIIGMTDVEERTGMVRAFLTKAEGMGFDVPKSSGFGTNLGRAAIEFALTAPETREVAEDLIMDPPDDDQLGVGEVPQYVAMLAFLVAFLQTRFEFRVSREDGQTKIDVSVGKEALEKPLMEKVIGIAGNLLSGMSGNAGQ
jgi:hypothetical protein